MEVIDKAGASVANLATMIMFIFFKLHRYIQSLLSILSGGIVHVCSSLVKSV